MTFDEKITKARELIQEVMRTAHRPAVMCSFGKDSMVLLHLVRSMGFRPPVIFHKEPFLPKKYRFARKVTNLWDLTVYDFAPSATAFQENGAEVEIVNYYACGNGGRTTMLPTGICTPKKGETPLCGLHDLYLKPTGTIVFPWDVLFVGHKSSDVDPIYGAVPLASDFARNIDAASAAFPLRHFTDDDVWEYHAKFQLPLHEERYEKTTTGWRERADKTHNPDYFPACTACMRRDGGPVPCPRLGGAETANVAAQLRWAPRENLPYMKPTATTKS